MTALVIAGAVRADAQEVVEYYATDAVGSIRVVFAPDGTVKARSDYLPFGEEWGGATPGGPLPSQRFTGQQRDAEENLDHFIPRSYQTRTGRLNSVDSVFSGLFEPQRWNRYAYALNNPLSNVDPDGRDPIVPNFSTGVTVQDPFATYMNWVTLPWHLTGGNYTIDGLRGLSTWQFEEYDRQAASSSTEALIQGRIKGTTPRPEASNLQGPTRDSLNERPYRPQARRPSWLSPRWVVWCGGESGRRCGENSIPVPVGHRRRGRAKTDDGG